jgi:hypothetical protein
MSIKRVCLQVSNAVFIAAAAAAATAAVRDVTARRP